MKGILRPSVWAVAQGFTKQAVAHAVRMGLVAVDADGNVIPEHDATLAWLASAREGNRHRSMKKKNTPPEAVNLPPSPAADTSSPARHADTSSPSDARGIMSMDRSEVEKIKLVSQIKQIEQKTQIQRGDFVDRELTTRILAKIFAINQSEFIPLAGKMAVEAAAICGADSDEKVRAIREYGETECWKIIAHCKRLINDFFDSIEAEPIE